MTHSFTQVINGTHRGNQKVWHFFDKNTGLNVMIDMKTGEFISGWKLKPEQISALFRTGNVQ
jgi:hypothetical protein